MLTLESTRHLAAMAVSNKKGSGANVLISCLRLARRQLMFLASVPVRVGTREGAVAA